MTKKQKILLWVSAGMFVIPEIMWSPVLNFTFSILDNNNTPTILRENFLVTSNYRNFLIGVVSVQLAGLLGGLLCVYKCEIRRGYKVLLLGLLSLLIVQVGLILALLFYTRQGIGF
jgi:hypothetical protein